MKSDNYSNSTMFLWTNTFSATEAVHVCMKFLSTPTFPHFDSKDPYFYGLMYFVQYSLMIKRLFTASALYSF